ncbi:hypothetical protein JI664_15185 [Rhodobacter sp. NTK016B]|uniref:flagellin n=1 Tax=Rhodobacter sp. NTK016B TaxID=2759676 RepID=UPI001A90B980|nr:flagellin [Rhodobacter sp. NTK016B]MBN8293317.1 hypothetical protein [Rhodobacter sp. NTK016B]
MTWNSLGSLALPFQLNRNAVTLRDHVSRLGLELTSGQVARPEKVLKGDLAPFSALESRLTRIDAFLEANKLATSAADITQTALQRVSDTAADAATRMLAVSSDGTAMPTLRSAAIAAQGALNDLSASLGQRVAGRAVFSGIASDTPPLPDADTIIAAILPSVTALSNTDDIIAAVTSEFMDPGGTFETSLYQGGAAATGAAIDTGLTANALPTAADPALRQVMTGLVISALAGSDSLSLSDGQRRALARAGSETLMASSASIAVLQGSLGDTQAQLDDVSARLTGERDTLRLARQNLVGADPYEVAGQLEVVQARLETLYVFTARTARLSLTEYL